MQTEYNKKIVERLKLMPRFCLGQTIKTIDGEGIIVELKMEWNGLYVNEESSVATIWYSTDEAKNGFVSRQYKITELTPTSKEYKEDTKFMSFFGEKYFIDWAKKNYSPQVVKDGFEKWLEKEIDERETDLARCINEGLPTHTDRVQLDMLKDSLSEYRKFSPQVSPSDEEELKYYKAEFEANRDKVMTKDECRINAVEFAEWMFREGWNVYGADFSSNEPTSFYKRINGELVVKPIKALYTLFSEVK